ncbi:hypothetical protein OIE71_20115 [Streptomyces sp. NBC_01725]|nr:MULTISPECIES: hypothetical protein [unclassified Streptomyces]
MSDAREAAGQHAKKKAAPLRRAGGSDISRVRGGAKKGARGE